MEIQKISVKAFALAGGLVWAIALLIVGLLNLMSPGYGKAFLEAMGSIYLWDLAVASPVSVLALTVIGFLDGAIGGFLFAVLYNRCSCCSCKK